MTILTKRILKITFWVLFIALDIVGLMALSNTVQKGPYTVDTEEFTTVVEFGDQLEFGSIKIIDNRLFGLTETQLTEDMIVSVEDTSTAGQKKVVFEHNNKQFTVIFDIKYRVEFHSYGELIDTQLAVTPDDLTLPAAPKAKPGYEFSHWDYDFSQGFTDNVQINAVFKELDYPVIPNIEATYGDTLADFTLPSNELGRWEFIDSLETPVGDAGKRTFNVRFVFNVDEGYYKYGTATVNVAKKQLNFQIDTDSFVYDGNTHFPSYTLGAEVADVISTGVKGIDAGTYTYSLEIVDPNYSGYYEGSYEITKAAVTVNVSSATIVYPQAIPHFTYTVEGFENTELLNITIVAPKNTAAGEYTVTVEYNNPNVDFTVNNGTLVVQRGEQEVAIPTFTTPTYGDKLSDLAFTGEYLGTWSWENPETVIDSMDGITAYAIFKHENTNYNDSRVEIRITGVQKRVLNIKVLESTFTYTEGGVYKVIYEIEGGDYSALNVIGNDTVNSAGTYNRTLYIDDARYTGFVRVDLVVNKATPVTDFTTVYDRVWQEGLTLGSIELPAGYAWVDPSYVIGAGEHVCDVLFTPADTVNYETVSGQFTVRVAKADVTLNGVKDNYDKDYDTAKIDIKNSGISVQFTDGTLTITYYKNGVAVDELVNTGTYLVVIEVSEGTNYNSLRIEREVVISAITNTQSVLTEQSAVYGDAISVLTLPEALEGTWSWNVTEIGAAGTKTFTAVYTPDANGNYLPREVSVSVTVSKKTVNVPTVSDKEFTGSEISQNLSDTAEYTVSGDTVATNVGTYTVTFTLTDPDNYEWFGDSEHVSVTRSYKISEAPNSWVNEPADMTVTYNGNPVNVSASVLHGEVDIVYTLNGVEVDAPTAVGTYKVTVTSTDPNYDELTKTVTIVIEKAVVAVPSYSATLPYNGAAQGITISDANLDVLYTSESAVSGLNAGDAVSVVLRLKDSANYKWDTTASETVTLTASVVKAAIAFTTDTVMSKTTWFFTEAEAAVTPAALNEVATSLGLTARLVFVANSTTYSSIADLPRTDGRLNAGTYYVKTVVDGSANWDSIETALLTFKVEKATPNRVVPNWGSSVQVDGLYYQNLLKLAGYTVYFGDVSVPVTLNSYGISAAGFAEGSTNYTFNVTPNDTNNFNSASIDVNVPLKKVATIDNNTAFGSIEDAVEAANAQGKGVVWVVPDTTGNVIITRDLVVQSGVTLRLPYGPGTGDYNSSLKATENHSTGNGTYDRPAETNPAEYLKLRVILADGKKLTIESGATLDIAGKFFAGGGFDIEYCGHTATDYAILELGANSTLDIKGTANVYGYIREYNYDETNGSRIHLYSGSTLYQPYVLRDFRSGNYLNVVKDSVGGPLEEIYTHFARFVFMNVSPTTTIDTGAVVYGNSNIYSTLGVSNFTGLLLSSDAEAFIQMTAGYMEFRYDVDEDVMYMHFYGGANLDNYACNTGIAGSLNSRDYPFVFSCHMNITLDKLPGQTEAIYNIGKENYQFKMLPGAKLTIEEGATVYIDRLNIYTGDFVDDIHVVDDNGNLTTYVRPYPSGKGDAILTVRGKLVAKHIGGKVHTDTDGAKILVTNSTTISNRELNRFTASFFSSVAVVYTDVSHSLELCYNGVVVKSRIMLNVEYTSSSENSNWNFEIPETVDVSLKNGYGVFAEFVLITDEFGNMYIDSYDSRTSKENLSSIKVVKGSDITFYLTKNQLLLMSAASSADVSMSDPLLTSTDVYEYTTTANSAIAPVVYYVPTLTLSGSATGTVTYTGLSESNVAGNSTVVITITATTSNTIYQNGTLSITVSGIDPSMVTFTQTGTPAGVDSGTGNFTITGTDKKNGHSVSITATIVITSDVAGTIDISAGYAQGTKECVTPDTLITLADGTQVRVDSLTGDELLLVWNLETGRFDYAPIMFVDSEAEKNYEVIYLYFSDGTLVKVIGEHGFWDYDLNRYVYLDRNAADYIGHTFAKQDGDVLAKVQLVNVEIKTERTTAWSPVTVGHLCYFVNGMLSMPGGVGGLFNIFEVDAQTMTYDFEAIERDIAEYGLFTYEELNAICPLTEDMFYAAGGAYLKISIAKGNLTMEELIDMIQRYSEYI